MTNTGISVSNCHYVINLFCDFHQLCRYKNTPNNMSVSEKKSFALYIITAFPTDDFPPSVAQSKTEAQKGCKKFHKFPGLTQICIFPCKEKLYGRGTKHNFFSKAIFSMSKSFSPSICLKYSPSICLQYIPMPEKETNRGAICTVCLQSSEVKK